VLEPDVALTDLGLALECAVLASLLRTHPPANAAVRRWFAGFFAALGAAALLGGIEHGFLADKGSRADAAVWTATLLALGVAALAAWGSGSRMILTARASRVVTGAAALVFAGYALVVLRFDRRFAVAIAHYLPAALFLVAAFGIALRRTGDPRLRAGLAGLGLTFAAAGVQQARIPLHPRYFDHNALYHAIQAVGLVLLYRGAARAGAREGARQRAPVSLG
jgi:hypothetical protein